jgi:CxxC motif-containing protein (DUF1111 family)
LKEKGILINHKTVLRLMKYEGYKIGPVIRDIRKDKGLLIEEVAAKTGISVSTLGQVEQGGRNLSMKNLYMLMEVYETDANSLLAIDCTPDSLDSRLKQLPADKQDYLKKTFDFMIDQAIYGVQPEGKLSVEYTYETFSFPDGEAYTLCKPNYTISEWYAEEIKPEDLFCTVRIPLRHVGMGQMMALDPVEIEALAAKSNYPEYGISGRCNYITERGVRSLGLSGNKAQHADLTVELGFSSDMGVTNSRYPEEICEGQIQVNQGSMMGLSYDQLDVSTEEMENVDLYMQSLGVPARRNVNDPQVIKGEQNFYKAKCHLCHVTTLHTKTRGSVLLNNTQLPWLGGQTIHPYSDYLLHDMGSEIMGVGLNDNYVSGLARGNEWRTTPLWGIGLQEKVNGHTYFLHDGRARNLTEAIMWHGGEGEASKNLFKNMSKEDRDALIAFLNSL